MNTFLLILAGGLLAALIALVAVITHMLRLNIQLDAAREKLDRYETELGHLDNVLNIEGIGHMNRLQRVRYLRNHYLLPAH